MIEKSGWRFEAIFGFEGVLRKLVVGPEPFIRAQWRYCGESERE